MTLGVGGNAGTAAASFTLVQHPNKFNCTTSACALTVTSTTSGNLGIVWSAIRYAGTGFAKIVALTNVTDSGSGTWTHCPQSAMNNASSSDGILFGLDCWYRLNIPAGLTSVTATWTNSGLTASSQKVDVEFQELSSTVTPLFYDSGASKYLNAACSSCAMPAGIFSGTSDFVSQAIISPNTLSSAGGAPYTNPFDVDATNNIFAAFAGALNQSSYVNNNWAAVSNSPHYFAAAMFGTNSNPSPTGLLYTAFDSCTNGLAITTTCGAASIISDWETSHDASSMGTGVTDCTAPSGPSLTSGTFIKGASRAGSGTHDFCGVTNVGGNGIGFYDIALGLNEPSNFSPMTLGYWFRSDHPANAEGGALARLIDTNSNYTMAHASPAGNGKFCLESTNGGTCQDSGVTYAVNTWYRLNTFFLGQTGGLDKLTICDSTGAVLGTATATSAAANGGITDVQIGITGEEPTTAGQHYYIRDIVVGGTYSTTSCF